MFYLRNIAERVAVNDKCISPTDIQAAVCSLAVAFFVHFHIGAHIFASYTQLGATDSAAQPKVYMPFWRDHYPPLLQLRFNFVRIATYRLRTTAYA